MIRLLNRFIKPYRVLAAATLMLLTAQAVSDLYLPNLMAGIVNLGILSGDTGYIVQRGGIMLAVALCNAVFAVSANFMASRIGTLISRDIRGELFRRVEDFSLYEFNQFGAASLITRTTNDITQIQGAVIMGFRFVMFSPIMCVGGLIMAWSMNRRLLWVLAVAVAALLTIMLVLIKLAVPLFGLLQAKIDRLNLALRESLTGVRVIRAFNKTAFDSAKFEGRNSELTAVAIRINRIMAFMHPAMMLIMSLTALSITWFGGRLISLGGMELGDMMAYTQYAATILFSVLMLVAMFVLVPRAQASAVRVLEVLAVQPEIHDPVRPEAAPEGVAPGLVEFREVGFSYEGAAEPVLSGISFTARPGEVTAIIGGTGSGKSTLINLIPRFYDVTAGAVMVGGRDVRAIPQAELRGGIGLVSQADTLFTGSVAQNIRFGNDAATDGEVEAAARIAQAYEFITEKLGFDGEVSAAGVNLSGGQRQRLAIARVIVRRPDIYIFDDSFSALDYKTDARLRRALRDEILADTDRPPTVIIIAQRISTVLDADRILVLDNGRLVGEGKHDELLGSCAVYREIVESQLGGEATA